MISIDVRMLSASGIGTYLNNLLPKLITALPNQHFSLIGYPEEILSLLGQEQPQVKIIACTSKIYSLQEQLELPRLIPKETTLFWSPHYNIPLLYQGRLLVTVHDAQTRLRQTTFYRRKTKSKQYSYCFTV
jgi:hypothetical protein